MANLNKLALLVLSTLIFTACDFTPPLLKEIKRAQELILEQKYGDAIIKYEKVLDKNIPKDIKVKIYYQLGDLYSTYLSKNDKAIEYYSKIIKISEDPLWLVKTEERIGEINFIFLRNYSESLKNYNKLANFTPRLKKSDFYELRKALSYFHMKKLDEAEAEFIKIFKNKSHEYYVISHYYLGLISFHRNDWNKAISFWKQYVRRERRRDNVVQAKFLMANAYETMERLKTAYNLYYSILGEYPNTEVIKNRLNSIYHRRIARKR